MNWREQRYYILEMRYKPNGFLMDEVEYYRSEAKAHQKCDELNLELKTCEDVIMINKPFVGKGCVRFPVEDVYYAVSDLRRPMAPEKKLLRKKRKGIWSLFEKRFN